MALKDYADIIVSFEAETVSRFGFGTLMFITEDTTETAGTVTPVFGSLQEVEDFGYAVGSNVYKFAQAAFSQGEGFSRLKVAHKDADDLVETWVEALNNTVTTDPDFYAVAIDTRDAADIEAVANDVEARQMLFIAVTADADVLDGQDDTDLASTLLDQNLSRTGLLYKGDAAEEYPEAAWFGRMLPLDPGTVSWAYKSLSGQSTDSFTTAEVAAMRAKRCNYYTTEAGQAITYGGTTSEAGVFLDVVRAIDWIQQRMQEDYIAVQTRQNRIPYVGGGEIIESEVVRRRLDIAVDRQVIADGYSVFVPSWRDQDPTDRAERNFPGITFEATLVGAVNTVQIRGTVRP